MVVASMSLGQMTLAQASSIDAQEGESRFIDLGQESGGGSVAAQEVEEIMRGFDKFNSLSVRNYREDWTMSSGQIIGKCQSTPCFGFLEKIEQGLGLIKIRFKRNIVGPDGQPRDAGNNGKDTVYLSESYVRSVYLNYGRNSEFLALLVHEYGVLFGLEENDAYGASSRIMDELCNPISFCLPSMVLYKGPISLLNEKIRFLTDYQYFELLLANKYFFHYSGSSLRSFKWGINFAGGCYVFLERVYDTPDGRGRPVYVLYSGRMKRLVEDWRSLGMDELVSRITKKARELNDRGECKILDLN